jgi:hypothetical protein
MTFLSLYIWSIYQYSFFLSSFFIFFPLHFLGKKCYFLFVTLRIFITSYLAYSYCHYFIICFIIFSFLSTLKKKLLYKDFRKMCYNVAIVILFYFSITLKTSLRSYGCLLTHMIFTIFYYI